MGVSTALDMILTGKQLRARQALKAGLVDDVVPQTILLEAAVELAKRTSGAADITGPGTYPGGAVGTRAVISPGA